MPEQPILWKAAGLTRVPYAVYGDEELARREQEHIFRGATWNYLCLEAELPEGGSYRATFVGETPVIVVKDDVLPLCTYPRTRPARRVSGPAGVPGGTQLASIRKPSCCRRSLIGAGFGSRKRRASAPTTGCHGSFASK